MDETTQTGSTPESKRMSKDPNPLSTEYHKARKQLMLWAAILFVWELVGIDLQKAKEAGGYASALINSIKSPQAVPWVLFILVPYFGFKLRTEWRQCNERRREVSEAKQDYYSACAFAAIAIALYIWQTFSHVQIADRIDSWKLSGITAALLVILCFLSGCAKLIALAASRFFGWHIIAAKWWTGLSQLLLAVGAIILDVVAVKNEWSLNRGVAIAIGLGCLVLLMVGSIVDNRNSWIERKQALRKLLERLNNLIFLPEP